MERTRIYEAIGQAHVLARNYAEVSRLYTSKADRLSAALAITDVAQQTRIVMAIIEELETLANEYDLAEAPL